MSPKRKFHQNANVTETKISAKRKCHQNANIIKTQMSLKGKCHQIEIVTKTQMSHKKLCNQNAIVIKIQMSPKPKCCHLNWYGTTRPPGLDHINPNGLPGHCLSDSRLVQIVAKLV